MQMDVFGKGLLSYALKVSAKTAETIRPTAAALTPGSSLRKCTVSGHCNCAQQRRLGFRILGFLDRRRWQQEGGWGRSNHVPAIDLEVSEHAPPAAEIPVTGSSVC